jgi:diadenosine tetraphosphatase ApaH/serine/threonine PP2A family protein phosphatase
LVVVGGDSVWGPMPQETMDVLRSLDRPVDFIMGNADRDVFDRVGGRWKEANDWCADRLSADHLDFLRSRPAEVVIDTDDLGPVLFCHGSPRSDVETITTATPDDRILEMCAPRLEAVVVCGHTHAQFERSVGHLRIVNAGSVGNPFGDPGAYWAMFGPDVELRFTSYDVAAAAEQIRKSEFPDGGMMANLVESPGPASLAAELFT